MTAAPYVWMDSAAGSSPETTRRNINPIRVNSIELDSLLSVLQEINNPVNGSWLNPESMKFANQDIMVH